MGVVQPRPDPAFAQEVHDGPAQALSNAIFQVDFIDRIFESDPRMAQTELISATGQTSPATLALLPRLRLGGIGLNSIRAAFAPLHIFNLWGLNERPAMLVGIDVLRNFDTVTLDFGRKEVTFVRTRRARGAAL